MFGQYLPLSDGEAILRHKAQERGLGAEIGVDSAGTGDWHIGNPRMREH